jgi:hypothetical protein
MTNNINYYDGSHYVLLTFEKDTRVENACSYSIDAISHLHYYERLRKSSKLISYGEIMNQPAVCVLLLVNSSDDFERIVMNDPALKSGAFKIKSVMPFINNNAGTIPSNNVLELMSEL